MPLKTIPLAGSKGPSSYNTSMGARVADEPEGCESASLLYLMSDRRNEATLYRYEPCPDVCERWWFSLVPLGHVYDQKVTADCHD